MKYIIKKLIEFIVFTIKCWLALISVVGIVAGIIYYQNNTVTVTEYKIKDNKIPKSFDDFKIVQLSDIQNEYEGDKLAYLLKKVKKEKPDIIAITGDLVDIRKYNPDTTLELLNKLKEIAPIYFIYGNHDILINGDSYNKRIVEEMQEIGVKILNSASDTIIKGNDSINILGIQDPSISFYSQELSNIADSDNKMKYILEDVESKKTDKEAFTILLSHRPEYFKTYTEFDFDIVLSGHAHGGQARIPFVGGLYAPGQGILPKYTSGIHEDNNTKLIISRGLGNSRCPIRVFNTPEIVSIVLKSK